MSKLTDWRKENPRAYLVLMGAAAAALIIVGLFGWAKFARADSATLQCPGANMVWDAATRTLTCPSTTGGGTPVPPTPPVPVPNDPFAGCPSGTMKIDGQWGNTGIKTADYGDFVDQIVSVRVAPPASWTSTSTKTSGWAEYGGAPTTREAVMSTVPCDFSLANALKNGYNQALRRVDVSGFNFQYRNGAASGFTAKIEPGKVYFINIRNRDGAGNPTCLNTPSCPMIGGLPQ